MLAIILVAIGPFVGSFLCVLIDRLPRGEDIVLRSSACRTCGSRLGWRDLVPILSYLACRGHCRHCGAAIPAWHLYVEIAAAGLAVLAVLSGGPAGVVVVTAVMLWTLLALAVTDIIWLRLPDLLCLVLLLSGFALSVLDPARGLADAAIGAGLGLASFWAIRVGYAAIRHREGLGLGDVKLMAGIGAVSGPMAIPGIVMIGAIIGLAAALARAALTGRAATADQRIPFGAALAAAAFLNWLAAPLIF